MLVSLGVGLLALALIAALTVTTLVQGPASAAQAAAPVVAQVATTVSATTTTTTVAASTTAAAKSSTTSEQAQMLDSFIKGLAAHLNVSESQLNAALGATIGDTLDQLVKSGQLTQAQADMFKKFTANGVSDLLPLLQGQMSQMMGKAGSGDAAKGMGAAFEQGQQLFQPVIQAAATSLNLTPDQLQSQLKAGKSLTDIAKAQNVDIQKVKDAILASGKTQLDTVVKSGKLTQSQADKAYQTAVLWIDEIVTMHGGSH